MGTKRLDYVNQGLVERYGEINSLLSQCFNLAGRIAMAASLEVGAAEIYESCDNEAEEIRQRLSILNGASIYYSGEGFTPLITSEYCSTIHQKIRGSVGRLVNVYMAETDAMCFDGGYMDIEDIDDGIDEMTPASYEELTRIKQDMTDPPEGTHLIAEFLVGVNVTINNPLYGSALTTDSIEHKHQVPFKNLEIHNINIQEKPNPMSPDQLFEKLALGADTFDRMLKSENFQKATSTRRQSMIDKAIEKLNKIPFEYYQWLLFPQIIYYPVIEDGERKIKPWLIGDDGSHMIAEPLRVDYLDIHNTLNRSEVDEDKLAEGLCVLVRVEGLKENDTEIPYAWLPILTQEYDYDCTLKDFIKV